MEKLVQDKLEKNIGNKLEKNTGKNINNKIEKNSENAGAPSELELAGIRVEDLKKLNDLDIYETLEDSGFDPEDYKEIFQNYRFASDNLICLKQLKKNKVDTEWFCKASDNEKYRVLMENNLNPYDYDVFFEDCMPCLRNYDRKMKFDEMGIDFAWFHGLSDIEKVEKLVMKGLDPFDFIDEFSDEQTALQKAEEIEQLTKANINYFNFIWKSDEEKLDLLDNAGLDPYGFYTYFEDPQKAEWEFERRYAIKKLLSKVSEKQLQEMTEQDKIEMLLKANLNPMEYKDLFGADTDLTEMVQDMEDKLYSVKKTV